MSDVTRILSVIEQGDLCAAEQLLPLVYQELRTLATSKMAHEQPGHLIQPTALVHEAYIRLVDVERAQQWNSRGHFFAAAAEAMRRILIENARQRKSAKYGGDHTRVEFSEALVASAFDPEQMLLLDDAVDALAGEDPDGAEVAKLCLFAGLSVEQAAQALGISRATAFRQWSYARAWLNAQLLDDGPDES